MRLEIPLVSVPFWKLAICAAAICQLSCSSYTYRATDKEKSYLYGLGDVLFEYRNPNIQCDDTLLVQRYPLKAAFDQPAQEALSAVMIFMPSRREFGEMSLNKSQKLGRKVAKDYIEITRISRKDAGCLSEYIRLVTQVGYEQAGTVGAASEVSADEVAHVSAALKENLRYTIAELMAQQQRKNIIISALGYADGYRCIAWGLKGAVIAELNNWEKVDFHIQVHRTDPPKIVATGVLSMAEFAGLPRRTSLNWQVDDEHEFEFRQFLQNIVARVLGK